MWVLGLLCAFNVLSNAGSIAFDPVLSMTSSLSADHTTAFFTVTFKAKGWFGFGISLDGTMGSSGLGSDVVVCSKNDSELTNFSDVRRYWIDRYGAPFNGTHIPGSNCTEYDGISVMTFTRDVGAKSSVQRGFNLTGTTKLIWAYNENTTVLNVRHSARGSVDYDIVGPPAPTPSGPIEGGQQLDGILSVSTSLASTLDKVTITVNSTASGWMGFGVSPDGSMTGGNGSDVVACSNNSVLRYWITQHALPTGGVVVPGAFCSIGTRGSWMRFTRSLAANSSTERPISATGPTMFIWAYSATSSVLNFHTNQSNVNYDVHNPPAVPTPSPTSTPTAFPSTGTPSAAPTFAPITGGTQLDPVYSVKTIFASPLDKVTIILKSTAAGWMGFGVSPSGTMTNNGNGSDIVACSNGTVKRYWVTVYGPPTGGVIVPNATCEQSAGGSTMQFTRLLAATSATERPISATGNTTFIWAYHLTEAVMDKYHSNQNELIYDVHNPPALPTAAPTPATPTTAAPTNNSTAPTTTTPTTTTPTTTAPSALTPTPATSAPTPSGKPIEGNVKLDSVLSLKTSLAATLDEITISLKSTKLGWVGFGVSPDGSMTGGGNGSDVVACSNGIVKRYWVTDHVVPTGGVLVPGATCEQSAGGTSMAFTRAVAASSATQRPISVTGNTTFIWAYSNADPVMESFHSNQSSIAYDVHNPPGGVTFAPTAVAPTPGGMVFDGVMSGIATLSEDKTSVHFVILAKKVSWMGFGVSPSGEMANGGKGSDVIICSAGVVKRYWVTAPQMPTGGSPVAGSSCKQENGSSTMEFTRNVAATTAQEREISVTGATTFIWAYPADGVTALTPAGHVAQGALAYDVATGHGGKTTLSPEAVLWLHMLAMLVAWGALLPFGVTFARYMRKHHDAKLWFTVHRTCQYIGWVCQLLGAVMAIIYVQSNGGSHFSGANAYHKIIGLIVVILGTLQPLNAYFRPHPHPDIDASRGCDDARTCWEFLHKGCGYLAIALGAFNVFAGVAVAKSKDFVTAFWLIPVVIAAITVGSMMLFAVYKEICGSGKEDPRPVVGRTDRSRKNSEMAGDLRAQLIPE